MSFKKNLIISALLVLMLICCVSAVSAIEDSSNITLSSDDVVDVVSVDEEDTCDNEDVILSDSNEAVLCEEKEVTIYVDSNYEGENETGTSENPYKTISGAINGATENKSTIFIKNGQYSESNVVLPGNKGFSFVGESENGVVISTSASGGKFIFISELNNASLSFKNIVFKNNYYSHALKISGIGNLNITGCTFDSFRTPSNDNQAAIYILNDKSTMKDCKIISFSGSKSSLIKYSNGYHDIENVLINNTKTGYYSEDCVNEGFICIDKNAIVNANNLTIANSYTTPNKGLIKVSGKLYIKNSNFLNNDFFTNSRTPTIYGLLYVDNGYLNMEYSVIYKNTGFNYFIYENGENSTVNLNYNVFINNVHKVDLINNNVANNNLSFNWWGTNDKPNNYVDNWVFTNISTNKNIDDVIVSFDLTKYTDGNNTYNLEKQIPFSVNFKSSNLTVNENIISKEGIASTKFTSNGDFYMDINYYGTIDTLPLSSIYVDSNYNGTELGTINNPYKTISKAIEQTTGWETIYIKNGNYTENNPITLINSLNLIGESEGGVIITGSNKGIFNNPFYMSKNIVLLFNNLTFKNVLCTANNAVLSIGKSVAELNITNCIFDNCSGQWGSMSISSSNLNMDNCKILDSKSTTNSVGAIYFNGEGNYKIINTLINNIESSDYITGIIVSNQNNALITLDNVQISNTVSARSILSGGKLNIKNTKIQNNKANNIFNIYSNFTLETSILSNNEINEIIYNNDSTSNIILKYNAILDNEKLINTINSYNNFDYNWWGTNDKPNEHVNNWVIIKDNLTKNNNRANVDIYFKCWNGTNESTISKNLPDGIEVNISTSTLDFNITLYTKNGVISTSFDIGDNQYVNITSGLVKLTEYIVYNTIYVDDNSTENGTGTEDNPYNSIQTAIDNAEDGDTIIIKNGSYLETIAWSGGNGVNIYGESKDNVLISLPSSSIINLNIIKLSLVNLTFISSASSMQYRISNGNLYVANCTFKGLSIGSRTLFSVSNGNLNIVDCIIDGVTSSGDVISISNSNSNIVNTKFTNRALSKTTRDKASIITYTGFGNHTFNNNYISGISFSPSSKTFKILGQVYINSADCNVEVDNLTIENIDCVAESIIYNKGNLNIKNSKIISNIVKKYGSNWGTSLFYNNNGNLNIESSIIQDNSGYNYFIYNTGANSVSNLNYNVIQGNSHNNGIATTTGVNNLDYNWWGSNTPTYADANNWIILDAYYTPDNIVSGENVTVVATLNHYITKDGEIGEVTKVVPVDEMEITFTLGDGTVLTQTTENGEANVTYAIEQSEKVTIKSGNAEISLPITLKTVRIDLEDNYTATEDANITINAPGLHANMTLIIDGNSETVEVNNTYVKTIENVKAGSHSVVVIYNDGSSLKYDVKSFTADKLQSQISLDNVTINVGESVPVEFSPANDATGRVFIDINGKKIFKVLEDGKVSIVLEDFAIGTYDVSVYYEGDGKYLASEDTFTITVNGFNANLKANASDIKVGENATVNIEIDSKATGKVALTIGNAIYPVTFKDGKACVIIPDLANGTYTATIKFDGDAKFLADEITVTFNVTKQVLPDDINVSTEIPEGTTAPEFTVSLPEDATGNFTVTVDGTPYTEELVNGSATVKVPEQTPGNHTISTSYSGDDKYDGFTSDNKTFDVPKASIPGGENALNMTTPADSATPSYSINLPNDATGNLTVTVDGKDKYSQALVNGSATVTLPELQVGKHDITVAYSGDDKYSGISKTTSVNVPEKAKPATQETTKAKTIITAKKKTYKAKTKVKKYTITLKSGKKPVNKVQVTLKIKGKTYKAKTNAKGKATFKIKKLTKKGKYSAVIKFAGNKNYKATSKKVKITVKK